MMMDLLKSLIKFLIEYLEIRIKISRFELEKEQLNKINRLRDELENLRNNPSSGNSTLADKLRARITEERRIYDDLSAPSSLAKTRDQG